MVKSYSFAANSHILVLISLAISHNLIIIRVRHSI